VDNQKLRKGKVMLKKSEQGSYEFEISISDFLSSLKKFWIIILAFSLVIAVGTFVFFHLTYEPTYTATVKLLIYNSDMEGVSIIADNYEYDKAQKLTSTYIDILMNTDDYLEKIVDEYKLEQTLGYDAKDLRSKINVSLDGDSGNFFKITVKDNYRATASLIAEAVVNEFKNDIMYAGNVKTFGEGVPSDELPSDSSRAPVMAVLAFLLSAAMIWVVLTIIKVIDTKIHTKEDVSAIMDYPILGVIPCIEKVQSQKSPAETRR
jgi:capsular polysaccharide biosynthesis protein